MTHYLLSMKSSTLALKDPGFFQLSASLVFSGFGFILVASVAFWLQENCHSIRHHMDIQDGRGRGQRKRRRGRERMSRRTAKHHWVLGWIAVCLSSEKQTVFQKTPLSWPELDP